MATAAAAASEPESLAQLLRSLRIGVGSDGEQATTSDGKPAPRAPTLPLTDQLSLLSAHIDTVRAQIAATVASDAGRELIVGQTQRANVVETRLSQVEERLATFESGKDDEQKDEQTNLRQEILSGFTDYTQATQSLERERHAGQLARVLYDAVAAMEALEERLEAAELDLPSIAAAFEQVNHNCAPLGLTSDVNASTASSFQWIGASSSMLPQSIGHLASRIKHANEKLEQLVETAWQDAITIVPANDGSVSVLVKSDLLASSSSNGARVTLQSIVDHLTARNDIQPRIEGLARYLLQSVVLPMLAGNDDLEWRRQNRDELSWSCSAEKIDCLDLDRRKETIRCSLSLLTYLKQTIFNDASIASSASLQHHFSKHFMPSMLSKLLDNLKSLLPSQLRLQTSNYSEARQVLNKLSQFTRDSLSAMRTSAFLEHGMIEDADDLVNFAESIDRHYIRHLGNIARTRCRDILLKEQSGGWESVSVEMEIAVPAAQAAQALARANAFEDQEVEKLIEADAASTSMSVDADAQGIEEPSWDAWDDADESQNWDERREPTRNVAPMRPSYLQGRSSPASQPSAAISKSRQKKTALGGVRVIKPQTELGSGPYPFATEDDVDESGWGFDDDVVTTSQALPALSSTSATAPPPADDEDEAWFQDEGVASIQSSGNGPQGPESFNQPSQSSLANPFGAFDEEDVDEDAWGLSEEEKAERAAKRESDAGISLTAGLSAMSQGNSSLEQAAANQGFSEGDASVLDAANLFADPAFTAADLQNVPKQEKDSLEQDDASSQRRISQLFRDEASPQSSQDVSERRISQLIRDDFAASSTDSGTSRRISQLFKDPPTVPTNLPSTAEQPAADDAADFDDAWGLDEVEEVHEATSNVQEMPNASAEQNPASIAHQPASESNAIADADESHFQKDFAEEVVLGHQEPEKAVADAFDTIVEEQPSEPSEADPMEIFRSIEEENRRLLGLPRPNDHFYVQSRLAEPQYGNPTEETTELGLAVHSNTETDPRDISAAPDEEQGVAWSPTDQLEDASNVFTSSDEADASPAKNVAGAKELNRAQQEGTPMTQASAPLRTAGIPIARELHGSHPKSDSSESADLRVQPTVVPAGIQTAREQKSFEDDEAWDFSPPKFEGLSGQDQANLGHPANQAEKSDPPSMFTAKTNSVESELIPQTLSDATEISREHIDGTSAMPPRPAMEESQLLYPKAAEETKTDDDAKTEEFDAWGLETQTPPAIAAPSEKIAVPVERQQPLIDVEGEGQDPDNVLQPQTSKLSSGGPTNTSAEQKGPPSDDEAEDAWDLGDNATGATEILSGSDGAPTAGSGEKSFSSGEKLSDVHTDAWDEITASEKSSLHPSRSSSRGPSGSTAAIAAATSAATLAGAAVAGASAGGMLQNRFGNSDYEEIKEKVNEPRSADTAIGNRNADADEGDADAWGWDDEVVPEKVQVAQTATPTVTVEQHMVPSVNVLDEDVSAQGSQNGQRGRETSAEQAKPPIRKASTSASRRQIHKESCLISHRSIAFVELVTTIAEDINLISNTPVEIDEATPNVKGLIDAMRDVLDLHQALMPVCHAETLRNVPTLAAQFANDCAYIAKELERLEEQHAGVFKKASGENQSLKEHAALARLLGERSFDAQILMQQRALAECLVETQGFEATHEDDRFRTCQRAMQQVITIVKQLSKAWEPVLGTSRYLAAMGRIVDSVLRRVLRDISSMEDISEVEGNRLAELVKSLTELEDIFRSNKYKLTQVIHDGEGEQAPSDVAVHVPSWFKASYLCDILTGSLVDIEFLYFEAEALVDYAKPELVRLIRALFSDTPKRARLIARIEQAQ